MFLDVYAYGTALYILNNQPLIYIFILLYEVRSCNVPKNTYIISKNSFANAVGVGFDSSNCNIDFLNFLFE